MATRILGREVQKLGGSSLVVSHNLRLRMDGLPYAKKANPDDKGVAAYFTHQNRQMCFACDRWNKIEDNIYAIAMTINALRGIDRWGSGAMVAQAFAGFVALPGAKTAYDILGVGRNASTDEIREAYRRMAKQRHPDRGWSNALMAELNEAYRELMKEKEAPSGSAA